MLHSFMQAIRDKLIEPSQTTMDSGRRLQNWNGPFFNRTCDSYFVPSNAYSPTRPPLLYTQLRLCARSSEAASCAQAGIGKILHTIAGFGRFTQERLTNSCQRAVVSSKSCVLQRRLNVCMNDYKRRTHITLNCAFSIVSCETR